MDSKLIEQNFNKLWELYPEKRGKSRVSKKAKEKLYKEGYEKIKQAIDNYLEETETTRREGFTELRYVYGSTFFNSRFEDYLPENYQRKGESNGQSTYKPRGCYEMDPDDPRKGKLGTYL